MNRTLQSEVKALKEKVKALVVDNEKIKGRVSKLEAENALLKQDNARLKRDNVAMLAQMEEMNNTQQALKSLMSTKFSDMQEKIDNLTRAASDLNAGQV